MEFSKGFIPVSQEQRQNIATAIGVSKVRGFGLFEPDGTFDLVATGAKGGHL